MSLTLNDTPDSATQQDLPLQRSSQPPEITPSYEAWKKQPSSANLGRVLKELDPVIDSAITTYASSSRSPIMRGRARIMALGAIRGYDSGRGASLNTHVMRQLQSLNRYARKSRQPLKMSERRVLQLNGLQAEEKDFYEEFGRDPSDLELADRLGISPTRIGKIRTYAQPIISAQAAPLPEANAPTIYKTDPQEAWLDYVYHDLDNVNKRILDWKLGRHGQEMLSNVEIARRLKVSPAAISQRAARIQRLLEQGLGIEQ